MDGEFDHTKRYELSDKTRLFLQDWLLWAVLQSECEDEVWWNPQYNRRFGLCSNAQSFSIDVWREIENLFDSHSRDHDMFPFGILDYLERDKALTQHLCPKRLEFVRANLPQLALKETTT